MPKLRPVTETDLLRITHAIIGLREARNGLRSAGAAHSAAYVSRAIKSAEGALRHAERCHDSKEN